MPKPTLNAADVAHRRQRLRLWIDTFFDGSQAAFIADAGEHGHEINQGELSGLLKNKSFGEKKARSLELVARMSPRWLDGTAPPSTARTISKTVSLRGMAAERTNHPYDIYTNTAVNILLSLEEADRKGALANLRLFVEKLEFEPKQKQPAPDAAAA